MPSAKLLPYVEQSVQFFSNIQRLVFAIIHLESSGRLAVVYST